MADIRALRSDTSTTKIFILRHNDLVLKQPAEISSLQAQVRTLQGSIRALHANPAQQATSSAPATQPTAPPRSKKTPMALKPLKHLPAATPLPLLPLLGLKPPLRPPAPQSPLPNLAIPGKLPNRRQFRPTALQNAVSLSCDRRTAQSSHPAT